MTPLLSAQQTAFFSKSGFLELEGLLSLEECKKFVAMMSEQRDLWRAHPPLQQLVFSKKLTQVALQATDERQLRVGLDQWMAPGFALKKPAKLSELFCIQGLSCAVILRFCEGAAPAAKAPLGLAPFPQEPGNALLVRPNVLLQWPPAPFGLWVVAYALPNAVYIQNPRDPAGDALKKLGYAYGDTLRNDAHPLIVAR